MSSSSPPPSSAAAAGFGAPNGAAAAPNGVADCGAEKERQRAIFGRCWAVRRAGLGSHRAAEGRDGRRVARRRLCAKGGRECEGACGAGGLWLWQRIARTAPKGDGTAPPKGDGVGAGAFASSDIERAPRFGFRGNEGFADSRSAEVWLLELLLLRKSASQWFIC